MRVIAPCESILVPWLLCLPILHLAGPILFAVSGSPPLSLDAGDKPYLKCGPNSLFLLSKLYGVDVDYERITQELPIDARGSSLEAMVAAANKIGIKCEARRCGMHELLDCPKAFIAHIAATRNGEEQLGHYLVVLDCDEDSVQFIDGTTGELKNWARSYFLRLWTGYVIMPEVSRGSAFRAILFTVGLWILLILLIRYVYHRYCP
jgi:ABC-type bacteriocin/lantibiotic exporter with double-glycine peptidase domain